MQSQKKVEPLELFFDLVFVFALTQVTGRMADAPTWEGLGRGLLILAAIWWAWGAYAWLTNEIDTRRGGVRLAMFASMAAMLVAALAIPAAFEGDALLFAVAYLFVRWLHIALFAAGSDDVDVTAATRALAVSATTAPLLLLVAVPLDDGLQVALWGLALVIDFVGGGLRGIGGWRLSPGHFAERHALIVIIALGESIVAVGVGASDVALDAAAVAATVLGVGLAAALWWTYFDAALERIEHRLDETPTGRARNTMARDGFSFLHLPMVAGIVLLALGVKKTLGDVDGELKLVPAAALCGGVALYLLADVGFRRRVLGRLDGARLLTAGAIAAVIPLATVLPALVALAIVAALAFALVGYEQATARA